MYAKSNVIIRISARKIKLEWLSQNSLLVVELVETTSVYQTIIRFDRCHSEHVELLSVRVILTF
jgi:hypothetical protein